MSRLLLTTLALLLALVILLACLLLDARRDAAVPRDHGSRLTRSLACGR